MNGIPNFTERLAILGLNQIEAEMLTLRNLVASQAETIHALEAEKLRLQGLLWPKPWEWTVSKDSNTLNGDPV